jgi:hypothetical protein
LNYLQLLLRKTPQWLQTAQAYQWGFFIYKGYVNMRYAILIDAGYFHKKSKRLIQVYNRQIIEKLINHIQQNVFKNDLLYRIFYYDAAPSNAIITNPLDNTVMNFGTTPTFIDNTALLEDIKNIPMIALRLGKISAQKNSWEIKNIKAIKSDQPLKPKQITPKINQKGVDRVASRMVRKYTLRNEFII